MKSKGWSAKGEFEVIELDGAPTPASSTPGMHGRAYGRGAVLFYSDDHNRFSWKDVGVTHGNTTSVGVMKGKEPA